MRSAANGDREFEGKVSTIIGDAYHQLAMSEPGSAVQHMPLAVEAYERGVKIAEKDPRNQKLVGSGYSKLGLCWIVPGHNDWNVALTYLEKSRKACIAAKDTQGEARADGNLGAACEAQHEYKRAIAHFERSLDICMRIGDRRSVAQVHGNLGICWERLGDYEKAIELQERCMSVHEELGNKTSALAAAEWVRLHLSDPILRCPPHPQHRPPLHVSHPLHPSPGNLHARTLHLQHTTPPLGRQTAIY